MDFQFRQELFTNANGSLGAFLPKVYSRTGQVGAIQISLTQVRAAQVYAGQVRFVQIRVGQYCAGFSHSIQSTDGPAGSEQPADAVNAVGKDRIEKCRQPCQQGRRFGLSTWNACLLFQSSQSLLPPDRQTDWSGTAYPANLVGLAAIPIS